MSGPLFPTGFCPDIGSHTVHLASARCPEPLFFGGRDGGLWEWPDLSCHSLVGSFFVLLLEHVLLLVRISWGPQGCVPDASHRVVKKCHHLSHHVQHVRQVLMQSVRVSITMEVKQRKTRESSQFVGWQRGGCREVSSKSAIGHDGAGTCLGREEPSLVCVLKRSHVCGGYDDDCWRHLHPPRMDDFGIIIIVICVIVVAIVDAH
jgi:hypothetical protein